MALVNKTSGTPIKHPNKEGVWLEVGAVYLIPTQINRDTTNIQVEFYRQLREGEQENPASRITGYVQTSDCGPHNLGEAPTTGDNPTFWQDIHNFAIEKLGNNFVKI